jgi:hypothetical protein
MAALDLRSHEGYRFARDTCIALAIYLASLAFPIPVVGILAFIHSLETLVRCIMSPASALGGDWLLGLSWLANPSAWAGMVFLLLRKTRHAAVCGTCALLLACCALRPHMFCQYIWLASIAYVVYSALCVTHQPEAASGQILARLRRPKLRPILYPAVALPLLFGLLVWLLGERGLIKTTPLISAFERANESLIAR